MFNNCSNFELVSPKSNFDSVKNTDLNNNFKYIPIKFLSTFETFLSRIWCGCLDSNIQQVGYDHWGWITGEGNIKPRWTAIPQASKAC